MFRLKYRPITKWPGKENTDPKNSPFRSTYQDTLYLLEYELNKLDYVESSLIVEMWLRPQDVFVDGSAIKAGAGIEKPGIILSLTRITNRRPSKTRPGYDDYDPQQLSYPCDAFNTWKDNLRAIALSLKSLRQVERYGVFKYDDIVSRLALPSAEGSVGTKESAAAFLEKHSGVSSKEILFSPTARDAAFRKAARALHPDSGGDQTEFIKLTEARNVLAVNAGT